MNLFERTRTAGHEEVVFCQDAPSGLRAIIAIHSTALGPSLGGIRMRDYGSEEDALVDVLRLAEAMSYKASVAGLGLGGGKAVILGVPPAEKRAAVFRAMGRFVDSLGGRYVPTEDMGTTTGDLETLLETSRYGAGITAGGGDPSPVTARGVLAGIRSSLEAAGLERSPGGRHVAIQGAGKVGFALAELLLVEGARVTVADVDRERTEAARGLGAEVAPVEEIVATECDVLAPCAGGAILDATSIPRLRCRIVAGGANNQLATEEDGERLHERGILYAPDFVINAGGLINVADELEPGGYRRDRALSRADRIGGTVARVLDESRREGISPARVALRIARERISAASG